MTAGGAQVEVVASYDSTPLVLAEVGLETVRAGLKFGPQTDLPDGTDAVEWVDVARRARLGTEYAVKAGVVTWLDVLYQEVCEAFAETDPQQLREELIQVAAVAVRWAQALDARAAQAVVDGATA